MSVNSKVFKLPILLILPVLLTGCLAERIENEERLKDDEADYRKCLLDNTADATKCDALKALYEEDKATL